jgi:hypothetical protein
MLITAFVLLMMPNVKAQDSLANKNKKFGHFIFNINSGLVISNAISNIEDKNSSYSQTPNHEFCYGYSGGVELLWGLIPEVTQSFGVGYDLSNSDFLNNYHYYSGGVYSGTSYSTNLHIRKSYQNFDLIYGWTFLLTDHVRLQIMGAYSRVFRQTNTQTGYVTVNGYTTYYNNAVDHYEGTYSYFSFRPKLVYDFKIKSSKFAVFVNFNWAVHYSQEWSAIGLQYYPLRKMR